MDRKGFGMKSFVKKWKNLLMIPFLCAALALSTGCGGKSSGSAEQTELPVVEESVEEQETQENQSEDNTEEQSGDEEAHPSSGDENGWGEDGEITDGETYGDDAYSDENGEENEEQQDWNVSDDSEDYSGDDSYSVANGDEDGDTDPEEGGYSEDENSSGGNEDRDYGEEYEGSGGEISENGVYTTKEDVALYLHTYGRLPSNFMTKKEAKKLGWSGGSLEKYAPGMCIGGDRFGNYEKTLPKGNYHECDINTLGKNSRGAERLVFSEDGRIYYTDDHYRSFTLLYEKQ